MNPESVDTSPEQSERLLLALADHLHEHCECAPGAPRCTACDIRLQLRGMREELLGWRSEGRRLAARRTDAIANGADYVERDSASCTTCRALSSLATAATS